MISLAFVVVFTLLFASVAAETWHGTEIQISAGPGQLYATAQLPLQKVPRASAVHPACGCESFKVDGIASDSMGTYTEVPGPNELISELVTKN